MTIGHNTISGQLLQSFVERVETVRAQKKTLTDDEAAIMAEAKVAGFVASGIRHVVKLRAMRPQDRQEAEGIADTYLHALGMATDTPLFRQVGMMSVDIASRDSVVEAMKAFVPQNGAITVEAGGRPIRLARDADGKVSVTEVVERPTSPPVSDIEDRPRTPKAQAPDVDADGAEALGREAFKANAPIIANPFPFGDARRPRWDAGWRKESGTDGMGDD